MSDMIGEMPDPDAWARVDAVLAGLGIDSAESADPKVSALVARWLEADRIEQEEQGEI